MLLGDDERESEVGEEIRSGQCFSGDLERTRRRAGRWKWKGGSKKGEEKGEKEKRKIGGRK